MKSYAYRLLSICVLALLLAETANAADAYYSIPISSLTLTEGTIPLGNDPIVWRRWQMAGSMQTYAAIDGDGEAYLAGFNSPAWMGQREGAPERAIAIRAPENKEVSGRLFVPKDDLSGMVLVRFKVPAVATKPEAKQAFLSAKESYYHELWDRNIPGAAWFRHQAEATAEQAGTNTHATPAFPMRPDRLRESELENTFDLFTGGRALSENLQLDRALPMVRTNEESVPITNLTGITVQEMNWKPLLNEAKPALDTLATSIPADQHALFFPSFQAMIDMVDEADANGTPVLQLLEPRAEDANARARYQKQLCLGLTEFSRLLGPSVVASVAFTGSDPFLRVGTDVAVVFEARNAELLRTHLLAQQNAARAANPEAKPVAGDIDGVKYSGIVSPDRSVCSYVASVSNIVFVSNSRTQLENLVHTAQGKAPALSSQNEYVFFRQRYPRSSKDETAFLVLSDATIRRLCGPQWRIADSRRTRVAAAMSELQAAHLEELAQGKATPAALRSRFLVPEAGEFRLTRDGVMSSAYGTLNFMTPIAEIPLASVTRTEAEAYQRWRDTYQRNWRQYFDPIAIRFSITRQKLSAELTVMPLIAATDYRTFINLTTGARIGPDSGDPHTNALLRLALAIDSKSQTVSDAGNFIGNMAPGLKANPFGWLGQSITLYADEDPFWDKLRAATNVQTFLEDSYPQLPVALHCEVKNALGVAAFLTALRAFGDQTAPQMTSWQNLEYNGKAYVKVGQTRRSSDPGSKDWAVYYAVTPDSLMVTLSESLLKRALDRANERAATNKLEIAGLKPLLGSNICLQVEQKFIDVLQKASQDEYQSHLQLLAWNNLPVLNEWKRLYPGKDPVKLHEALWGTKLLCPGGGSYVWNEKWQTMESTVFGHPGEPKLGSTTPLAQITGANLGVSFENQGMSARAILDRTIAK